MLRSASALALSAALFSLTSGVASGQSPTGLSSSSPLRGVAVRQNDGHLLIDMVPRDSPAAEALHPGDVLLALAPSGRQIVTGAYNISSLAEFYDLASRCVPDCLIQFRRPFDYLVDHRNVVLGTLGTNFVRKDDPAKGTGYVERATGTFFPAFVKEESLGGVPPATSTNSDVQARHHRPDELCR